jgi:predicted Zn-dependent protease
MLLSSDDAKAISEKIIARSSADACVVKIDGGEDNSLRFARGGATTNITTSKARLRISSHIGRRVGAVTTTRLDDDALDAARVRSEEIARVLPVDPDYVAPLGPQNYDASARYDEDASGFRLDALAAQAARVIAEGAMTGKTKKDRPRKVKKET